VWRLQRSFSRRLLDISDCFIRISFDWWIEFWCRCGSGRRRLEVCDVLCAAGKDSAGSIPANALFTPDSNASASSTGAGLGEGCFEVCGVFIFGEDFQVQEHLKDLSNHAKRKHQLQSLPERKNSPFPSCQTQGQNYREWNLLYHERPGWQQIRSNPNHRRLR